MHRKTPPASGSRRRPLRSSVRRCLFGAAVLVAASAFVAIAQQQTPGPPASPGKPNLLPQANRPPDANAQTKMGDQQTKNTNDPPASADRKKQIADDAAKLVQLATELKAEVDKTSKDTLSINVIRKADSIEKLAKGVKEKMKLTAGAS